MTFNNVAIDDGRMAGLELGGNLILGFDGAQVVLIFALDRKAVRRQVLNPCATATSGWRFVDRDGRGAASAARDRGGSRAATASQQARSEKGKQQNS
jgi:hypothetical protein